MTTERVFNFGAGPAVLPDVVLKEARRDLMALPGIGISALEISHRSKAFTEIIGAAETNIRQLANVPDGYHVLFLQGGATQQFSMVPLNLCPPSRSADYILTGTWAKKAYVEAGRLGKARVAGTTETDGFSHIPETGELDLASDAAYVHVTSNNTICGTQWATMPETGGVPLVSDASSDIFSRPIDVGRHGLIYAGAQKNLGPAGVTLVIAREDLVAAAPADLPTTMRYATAADAASLYNTPPVFTIYLVGLVLKWLVSIGGLGEMARRNARKADLLYAAIDRTAFYEGTARPDSRSRMNVTFRLQTEALDTRFVTAAAAAGLVGLKGHRSLGGQRASIYNALPEAAVDALAQFMAEFERANG
jgi:phosphoserine aminotransferase